MVNKPKISIIIPVYNAEKTISNTVKSILKQKCSENTYEIILVDDGSSDKSGELCDYYASKYPEQIKAYHQENQGSFPARLKGWSNSLGQYILYVDADDLLLQGAIEQMLEDTSSCADMYMYDFYMDDVGGKTGKHFQVMPYEDRRYYTFENKKELVEQFIMKGTMNSMCCTLFRRDLILPGDLNTGKRKIRLGEDRIQKVRLLCHAETIEYIPYVLYHYIWHDGSQGEGARKGGFSLNMYWDFKAIDSTIQNCYAQFPISKEDKRRYNAHMLTQFVGQFDSSVKNKTITGKEFKAIINKIEDDAWFRELYEAGKKCVVGVHNKISLFGLIHGWTNFLWVYFTAVNVIRSVKYGRQ